MTRPEKPLSKTELQGLDAYWRAANYLSVGQIYLYDNPLLRKRLTLAHIKPRLLGHWGTTPGLNFVYVHLNRVIRELDLNAINITVINPSFILAFMGTGFACLLLAVGTFFWWGELDAYLLLIASMTYLIGCIGVTMGFNVPLNNMLAGVQSSTLQANDIWLRFLNEWTFWNHVRTVASAISAIMLTLILIRRAGL